MAHPPDAMLISLDHAAKLCNVSPEHMRNLLDAGKIPEVKLGRRRMIPKAAIVRLVETAMAGVVNKSV